MRSRTVASLIAVACLLTAVFVAPGVAAAKGKKKKSGPVVVGTDADNDWGANVDPTIAPLGDALGQELVEASISMADASTVNLIIKLKSLPPSGGIPEFVRYDWGIVSNGEAYQVTGNFTEYLRGTCNPLHTGACPPPQDPGMGPFFIRQGSCSVGEDCFVLAIVHATFDAATATITIPVPLDVIGAKPGSVIAPGVAGLGGTIAVSPQAVVSQASAPIDTMSVTGSFKVPGKKG